ncbi:MAG: type II toxin-antitoxin system VapC family toxin [Rhizobiales bacterium]|nr:type II toxin-antitoxin system VapC family toxin [Hyphomicrobiales bacterium]
MTAYVIDASIAVKWVVEETGTANALVLRQAGRIIAPELLLAECANILWKKVRRRELTKEEAILAARLLQGADMEIVSTRSLAERATSIAIELDHPAYDCVYIALAAATDCRFVTADDRLLRKLRQGRRSQWRDRVISLAEAAALSSRAHP